MTAHEWLSVFIVDGCNRALDKQGGPFVRVAEKAIRNTLLGLLDEAKERYPILGVQMDKFNLKEVVKALLPFFRMAASKTTNPYDNWVCDFLEQWATSNSPPAAVMAAMAPPPS